MNASEWRSLVGPLLPGSERWAFRGKLCYRQPLTHVLVGVLGEPSGSGGATYVWRVTMPIFVPSETLVLSWSERVGGGAHRIDNADPEGLRLAVSRAVSNIPDETTMLGHMVAMADDGRNLLTAEAAAYALLLLGNPLAARRKFALARGPLEGPPWIAEVADRMRAIDNFLEEGGDRDAVNLLGDWERTTASNLRLAGRP